jgi:hypothetical protein
VSSISSKAEQVSAFVILLTATITFTLNCKQEPNHTGQHIAAFPIPPSTGHRQLFFFFPSICHDQPLGRSVGPLHGFPHSPIWVRLSASRRF